MKLVWHYTTGKHLKLILASGTLRLAEKGIAKGERPACWFSKEQTWEPTAQKWSNVTGTMVRLGMLGTYERYGGLGRIGVDPTRVELCDFETFVATSGIPASHVREMKKLGRNQLANPINWLASFIPVSSETWVAVESYNGTTKRWVEYIGW